MRRCRTSSQRQRAGARTSAIVAPSGRIRNSAERAEVQFAPWKGDHPPSPSRQSGSVTESPLPTNNRAQGSARRPRSLGRGRRRSKFTKGITTRAERGNRKNRARGGKIDFQGLRRKRELRENTPKELPLFRETKQAYRWIATSDNYGGSRRERPQDNPEVRVSRPLARQSMAR